MTTEKANELSQKKFKKISNLLNKLQVSIMVDEIVDRNTFKIRKVALYLDNEKYKIDGQK